MKNSTNTKHFLYEYILDEELTESQLSLIRTQNGRPYVIAPTTPEWCEACNGTGMRSDWDNRGLDIDAMLEDDEDREAYFGGSTDVPCSECNGDRVFSVVDYENISDTLRSIIDIDGKIQSDIAQEKIDDAKLYAAEMAF